MNKSGVSEKKWGNLKRGFVHGVNQDRDQGRVQRRPDWIDCLPYY